MDTLQDPEIWEDWFDRTVKPLVDPAYYELSRAVWKALDDLRADGEKLEGIHRDRWELFAPAPIKSAARVRTKLLGDGVACTEDDALLAKVLELGDLARFRVVATLKRDVTRCRKTLLSPDAKRFLERYDVHKFKDFVRDEGLRKPLVGHRALQVVVGVPCDGVVVRVEVQIMTLLQHVWDRRNHAMYEWLRERQGRGDEEVDDLRIDDHSVAESLHAIDALADHNFDRFLALRRQG